MSQTRRHGHDGEYWPGEEPAGQVPARPGVAAGAPGGAGVMGQAARAGTYRLVVLRHGESEWNASNRFAGWVNVALTEDGEREAARARQLLAGHGLLPDFAHTSVQRRSIRTADLALAECDRDWIGVRRSWRLNSNHYGALQGRNKAQVRQKSGELQFMAWRRSYDAPPPPVAAESEYSQFADPRYAALPPEARPRTESLKDVTARLLPYWYDVIVAGPAHGSVRTHRVARQHAAGADQAPRPDIRRAGRGTERPDGYPAGL